MGKDYIIASYFVWDDGSPSSWMYVSQEEPKIYFNAFKDSAIRYNIVEAGEFLKNHSDKLGIEIYAKYSPLITNNQNRKEYRDGKGY